MIHKYLKINRMSNLSNLSNQFMKFKNLANFIRKTNGLKFWESENLYFDETG